MKGPMARFISMERRRRMARFETKPETADEEAPEWVGPSAELLPKPARRKRKSEETEKEAAVVSGHYGKNDEERGKEKT